VTSWQIILPWLVPMLVLALLSALFSGAEAALFSLRDRDLRNLKRRGASGRMAAELLLKPERLLSTILFWNLLVNMTYFGIAGIVAGRLENFSDSGARGAVVFTITSLFFIIFFSEMLPKSVGVLLPRKIAWFSGLPMMIAVRVISPALPLISGVNLGVQRLLWPSFTPEPEIDLEDIGRAIELGTHDAALAKQEQSALQNLVNLAEMRIDECMRPRSQLLLVRQPVSSATLADQPPAGGYALVIENEAGEIVGSIGTLSLRPHHFDDLAAVIEPVCYVPWSASASSVLDLLHKQRISVAVVVNEFGESIGALSIEDIMRQVLTGRFEHVDFESQQPMETLGAGHYRVSGAMRLRKIAKLLEIPPPEGRTASIMGLMQRLNERPPRLGDTCEWDDYRLEVTAEQANGSCIIDIRHIDTIKDEPEPDVPSTQDTGMQAPDTPQEEPT